MAVSVSAGDPFPWFMMLTTEMEFAMSCFSLQAESTSSTSYCNWLSTYILLMTRVQSLSGAVDFTLGKKMGTNRLTSAPGPTPGAAGWSGAGGSSSGPRCAASGLSSLSSLSSRSSRSSLSSWSSLSSGSSWSSWSSLSSKSKSMPW